MDLWQGGLTEMPESEMIEMSKVTQRLNESEDAQAATGAGVPSSGLGFERVTTLAGTTYKDNSTVVIVPSRDEMFHVKVVSAWSGLIAPMNQKRAWLYAIGDEVGHAYNRMIADILANPELSKWKYVMTLESDNLPPPDAQIRLLECIEQYRLDAVSGIYFTKGDINMPMAYGDPAEFARTGVLDFRPRDITECLAAGTTMEVNGIACGCSLYRMDLFREVPQPWFVTTADLVDGVPVGFTQDLHFCMNARKRGKRFGVDMRVRVGHLDLASGTVY